MTKKNEPVFDEDGTHVYLTHPDLPENPPWACPVGVADSYIKDRGWLYAQPQDTTWDGLLDSTTAEPNGAQTGFDPTATGVSVEQVNDHLKKHAEANPGEVVRVLELEKAGAARKGILETGPFANWPEYDPNNGDS